tara:strand:+ start:1562 stop:3496 length:1935 start_codon:yes stop_codon:yes gene_type:complete
MKTLKQIQEERGEKAFKQAMQMGLKYGGFGYWKDPHTGETTYKTENDVLVPVESDEGESELAGKGEDQSTESPGGGLGINKLLNKVSGEPGEGILGSGQPGGQKERGWRPGPEGDNCVNDEDQPTPQYPKDGFVGRTNYMKWRAGPDGDNITTTSVEKMMEEINSSSNAAKDRMGKIMGQKPMSANDFTNKAAKSAVDKMRKDPAQQEVLGKQIASMRKIAHKEARPDPLATRPREPSPSDQRRQKDNNEADMWRKAAQLPAIQKDADAVKQMNEAAKPLVKDPNYKMDQFNDSEFGDDYLDEGAFGQVFEDRNGNVVKKGALGPDELKALYAMRDNPAFPTLINAKFDSPFLHQSSVENNPMGGDKAREPNVQDYWNPEEQSDFDRKFPTAQGTYAMTQAKGSPLFNIIDEFDDEEKEDLMRKFWRARGDLHKAGFSHNDMHGGNVFADEDGNVSIIDLGLAKENRLSAFMEALGGMDYEQGQDTQLTNHLSGSSLPDFFKDRFDNNRAEAEQMILDTISSDPDDYDDYDYDSEYSPTMGRAETMVEDIMRGNIRMSQDQLEDIAETIPFLADDNNVKELIRVLYKEVGQSELSDRMSAAFSEKQKDTRVIDAANKIRKGWGEGPIEIKNKNVIPPENMDFDD